MTLTAPAPVSGRGPRTTTGSTADKRRDPGKRGRAMPAVIVKPPWKEARWRRMSRHGRAIKFQETYCRSPKGKGHGQPLRLGRFQREFLEEALADGVEAAILTTGRGNGKSTEGGALAVWAVFDDDETGTPQVPVVATTVTQAIRSCYGVAVKMVEAEPELRNRSLIYTGIATPRVVVPFNGGELSPISNDVDGLQGLDPSLAIIDEIGFQPQASFAALKGAGGKRERSLLLGLGTKGTDPDNALEHIRKQILELGGLPGFVYREYSAPPGMDWRDPAAWRFASPAIAEGFLRESAVATDLAMGEGWFRVFRLNQTLEGVDSWLGSNAALIWDALKRPRAPILEADTWAGVDVGIKRDSTAVVFAQRQACTCKGRVEEHVFGWCRLWIPTADVPVDVTDVMDYLRRLDRMFRLRSISYDPRFFDVPAAMLSDEHLAMDHVPQSPERMTPIIGTFHDEIKGGRFHHTGDPAFRAHVLNAKARYNPVGFTLQKLKSTGRIDGAIAGALATHKAVQSRPKRKRKPRVATGQ